MKHKFFTLTASLILATTAVTAVAPSQVKAASTTSKQTEMYDFVRDTFRKHHVRGIITVVQNGVPQTISYGYAWYGRRLGNGDDNVVYPTASLQKVLTGAMIVQLINETSGTKKAFSQYTKISRWYPNLRNASRISVGNLLTHTSGIMATRTEINRGYNYSENQAVNWVVNNINASASDRIGSFHYNNSNYILLVGIIRQITGKSYESNFQSRIIDKLKLRNTYLYQNIPRGKTDPISYYSNGYRNYQRSAYVKRSLASQIPGAGNLFTLPEEYYKMQVGLSDGSILNKDDFHYLTHLKSKQSSYSGGLYLKNKETVKTAYGNFLGLYFGTWVQLTTDNKNGIVMFLNQTNGNEDDIKAVGYEILQRIKPNTFVPR